jgi:glutaconate CoA-transferase subunit B
VITDFGVLTPHPQTDELQLTALFAPASVEEARAAVGWPLMVADNLNVLTEPSAIELDTLRALKARTAQAHDRLIELPIERPIERPIDWPGQVA